MSIKTDKDLMDMFNTFTIASLEHLYDELGLECLIEDGQITGIGGIDNE